MQIIVIGAGASGMMAAITAARNGCKVTVLEHTAKSGRKIEITGHGKCNFTNSNQSLKFYRTEDTSAVQSVLKQFSYLDTIEFFRELGVYPRERNGYFYPASSQASAVADLMRLEAEHLKVKFACNIKIQEIRYSGCQILVHTGGYQYQADALIIATGSKAAPVTGSDGSGYALAQKLGHSVIKPLPALVQLLTLDKRLQSLAGLRTWAKVSVKSEDTILSQDTGEIQFTQNAISGIPVFQVSRYAIRAIDHSKKVMAILDFMPDMSEKQLQEFLYQRKARETYKTLQQFLTGLFHKKLIRVLVETAQLSTNQIITKLSAAEWKQLISAMKYFKVSISEKCSFEQAQACSGGIPFSEVKIPSLESKLQEKVYFAGEILDVDGACGGYNLQWAWASGYCAGMHASKG